MAIRWRVLALLFTVRAAMGIQFQAIGALSPVVMESYGVGLAEIGLMIGLYLSPGVLLAMPGGALGARFGDKRIVMTGLVLMLAGAVLSAIGTTWEMQITARVLAGVGGVLLNVVMSKMVTDWFAGREIATAMGIFVNSWPFGIALALLILPVIQIGGGLALALWAVVALMLAALVAMALLYRTPELEAGQVVAPVPLGLLTGLAVLIAGLIWGMYNAAFSMIFSFGPAFLTERGWSLAEASGATSVVLWLAALSVPAGGVLADRLGRRDLVLVASVLAFAVLMFLIPRTGAIWTVLILTGFICGLPAGSIMSLPAQVLSPGNRAVGMGVFYTMFYASVVAAPWIGGWLAERAATPAVTFDFGTGVLVAVCAGLVLFHALARSAKRT